jgi:hypothetical protein
MSKGVTFLLRSAIDAKKYLANNKSSIILGQKRWINYQRTSKIFFDKIKYLEVDRIIFLDNTLKNSSVNIQRVKQIMPRNVEIVLTETNKYGIYNKGAGDIETLKHIANFKNLLTEYIFYFELRLELISLDFIADFKNKPRNLIHINPTNNSATTGYFGCKSESLFDFANTSNLESMIKDEASIEYLLGEYAVQNNWELYSKNGSTIRYDPVIGPHLY